MPSEVTIRTIGDWKSEIGVPLSKALRVSMDVTGRTAADACKHAIILMAQSARHLAKQGRKRRKIERGSSHKGSRFVWFYSQKREPWKVHLPNEGAWNYDKEKEGLTKIRRVGLAKRSWMWGLRDLGEAIDSKPMSGIAWTETILGRMESGYQLTNTLSYVDKAMPPGWESEVELRAGNKIMAQARDKLAVDLARVFKSGAFEGVSASADPMQYFLRV